VDVDRDVKVQQLLDAAEPMFIERGYAHTPLAEIATEASVATNALTWYFPSKDDLFIAVLDRVIARELAALSDDSHFDADLAVRAATRLHRYRRLITAVHERARVSPAVAQFHDGYHQMLDAHLTVLALEAGVPREDASIAVTVFVTFLEGLLLHDHDDARSTETSIRYLVARLTGPPQLPDR
jgi:AcrR family transcriptional regulator